MGALSLTSKFTSVHVSAVRQSAQSVAVGVVFRTREGANVRKTAFALASASLEQGVYEGILNALAEAARCRVRGLTLYVDNPQVVDQLNRRAAAPPELQSLFVQVRCRANALRRVRIELAKRSENFAARRLARSASADAPPVNIEYDNVLLPLSFGDDGRV